MESKPDEPLKFTGIWARPNPWLEYYTPFIEELKRFIRANDWVKGERK